MPTLPTILVVPATGRVGSAVVAELVHRGVPTRALVRSAEKARELFGDRVEIFGGFNYDDPATARAALEGVERAFVGSTIEDRAPEQTRRLLEAARSAGVRHIVRLSVFRCDDASKGFGAALPGQRHAEVERTIEELDFAYTHLRPTWFYQNFERLSGRFIRERGELQMPFGDAPVSHIDARDVGVAAAVTLSEPGHKNRVYELTGPTPLRMAEVAVILSHMTGREIRYVDVSFEDSLRWMIEEEGVEPKLAHSIARMWEQGRLGNTAEVTDELNRLIGRPGISFEEYAAEHRQAFLATNNGASAEAS